MPININDPEYTKAEKLFHESKTIEDQLIALNKMISHAPSHKGAENLRQQLTTRRKKLELQLEKKKKAAKSTKIGIKKEDMQVIIVGYSNVGKSSLLKILTNAQPKISEIKYTTKEPQVGIMEYQGVQIQVVEIPAIDGDFFDKSIAHTADTILLMITNFEDIEKIKNFLSMITGKIIIVYAKNDLLSPEEKRKMHARLQSKRYNFELISSIPHNKENGIEELKEKIFNSFEIIRVFTKEPGKNKSLKPIILKPNSTVKDVAEKILKGFSKKVKVTKIWGPSSKFGGQIVGLNHKLKDLDTVEFSTK